MGLPSANVTSFAPVLDVIAVDDCGDCRDVLFALLPVGFKFLSPLFSHTMRRMMRTIVMTTSSTTTTPATIPADDPLVVLSSDLLSVVHFTSA